MAKRFLWTACKYALGSGALAYVLWRNWSPSPGSAGLGVADALAKPLHVLPLVLAGLFCAAALFLTFARWYVLVRAQGLPFNLPSAVRLGLIGLFFSTFFAGEIGGDIVRAAGIAREQGRRTLAVATVLVDRAMGLWGLVCLVALTGGTFWALGNPAVATRKSLQGIIVGAVAVAGLTLGLWLLLGALPAGRAKRLAGRLGRIPRAGHAASELWRAVWMYRRQGHSVALALLIALASHVCYVSTFYFAVQTFQETGRDAAIPSFAEHFLLVPVGELVQAVFPAPGGVGGAEYGYGKLYLLVGQPEANGVLAALAYRVIVWGLSLTGYFVYLGRRPALRPEAPDALDLAAAKAGKR